MSRFSMVRVARRCGGCFEVKHLPEYFLVAGLTAGAWLLGGCSVAQIIPAAPPPFGEVASEELGVVAAVEDTMIDLRTGQGRALQTSAPMVPVGPVAVSLPITIGGEAKREIPGEDITVKLINGKMVHVVQAQGSPPFAVGEQVKVQHEKPNRITEESRTRVVRAEDVELLPTKPVNR